MNGLIAEDFLFGEEKSGHSCFMFKNTFSTASC